MNRPGDHVYVVFGAEYKVSFMRKSDMFFIRISRMFKKVFNKNYFLIKKKFLSLSTEDKAMAVRMLALIMS